MDSPPDSQGIGAEGKTIKASMRVLLVNAYAKSGGASVAASRLCNALNERGATANLLVQNSEGLQHDYLYVTNDRWSVRRPLLDVLPVLPWRHRRSPHWGNAWMDNSATRRAIHEWAPDVTHLHWVNHGMLSIRDVAQLRGPVVWTLHDSWVFTGGCHSPQDCRRFEQFCGACPELGSKRELDLSRWILRRKQRAWTNFKPVLITPSHWLARNAGASQLFSHYRIEVIANVVPFSIFKPVERASARRQLGLPLDKPLILFAGHNAMQDWNKGGDLLTAALHAVAAAQPDAAVVVAGNEMRTESLPVQAYDMGPLDPDGMARALNAVDILVLPSRMENLPNLAAESLACGTPVVTFSVGGLPEMIEHGQTGYLAQPFDTEDLARGIVELIDVSDSCRDRCFQAAQRYAPAVVAEQHLQLYRELLEQQ
jgi:glycosyltransferase involved in cell wall biosynthesis